jgi:hypothetical protein
MTAPELFERIDFTGDVNDLPMPTNGPYFVQTGEGYFVMRDSHFYTALVPIKKIQGLETPKPTLWHDVNFPAELLGQAYSFFKAIYEAKHSEAMVDITWSKEKGYRLFVMPQKASHGGVQATRNLEHYQGMIVGTIHSHCNFDAFHSGTDTHDADGHDGLHITIGDVMKPKPSIAIMLSADGHRWDLKYDDITDAPLELVDHPKWWENFVNEPDKQNQNKHVSQWTGGRVMDDDEWQAFMGMRPTYQTPHAITGPTKQNPVVVSGAPKSSLEMLAADYKGFYDFDDFAVMAEASDYLDVVRETLEKIGIEINYEFTPILGTPATSDPTDITTYFPD